MTDEKARQKRLSRLRRMGVKKGTRHIDMPPPKPKPTDLPVQTEATPLHFLNYQDDLQHAVPIEKVVPGYTIENEHGQYFSVDARYPLTANYGAQPLSGLLNVPMETIATITGDERWHGISWREVLFIDTETTGLEIAAGTIAFLIGVGFVDGDDFVVRQVFMRDFNEEMALLADLRQLCEKFKAVASFNGKTFDVPLLENRFIMARQFIDLFDGPHLDLLHHSRRIWRHRLENCKLATLETDILGLTRDQSDIPGYFIPSLYRKYLVDGDARTMAGIFYHNELDIVSMAALVISIAERAAYPYHPAEIEPVHPIDLHSIGLWHLKLGLTDSAEQALRAAITDELPETLRYRAMTELAFLLKRSGRANEAETLWQSLVAEADNLSALEELAKFYEWEQKDFEKARTCVEYALKVLGAQNQDWRTEDAIAAWMHRQNRILRKSNTHS